ncbi:MAG TPA: hypothetical protein VLL08_19680 [Kineosporiaceae bacterium]|nr:hypothetical protein [Kineosporiaceae bacterium]
MTSNDLSPESVIDVEGAAGILGVEPGQIIAMIDEGLLHPLEGHRSPTFDTTEVQAVRGLGG